MVYVDDLNAFREFDYAISDDDIRAELVHCQKELHKWGEANQVTFDARKEHFAVISLSDPAGENFKVLGLEFDSKLSMHSCVHSCVVDVSWRFRSLLRTLRFFHNMHS